MGYIGDYRGASGRCWYPVTVATVLYCDGIAECYNSVFVCSGVLVSVVISWFSLFCVCARVSFVCVAPSLRC